MNIVLGSAFRNAAGRQIDRWIDQCRNLDMRLESVGDSLRLIAVEGDSIDRTREHLESIKYPPISVVTCNHGQRVFGSTEESDRLKALSMVGNAILSSVNETDDILVYVESDLIWSADTIARLISSVLIDGCGVIAPMVFAGDLFYDVFLFRGLDGNRFSPFYPYHSDLQLYQSTIQVQSAGSCLVMKGEIARQCRIRNDQALLGFCEDVREKGWKIFVDPNERIHHP